jgi:hypothetical protein
MDLRIEAADKYQLLTALEKVCKQIRDGDQSDQFEEIFAIEPGTVIRYNYVLFNGNNGMKYSISRRDRRALERKLRQILINDKSEIKQDEAKIAIINTKDD